MNIFEQFFRADKFHAAPGVPRFHPVLKVEQKHTHFTRGRGGGTALAMGVRGRPATWEDWQPSGPQCGDRCAGGVGGLVNVPRRVV